jgi:predicted dehydrogenase
MKTSPLTTPKNEPPFQITRRRFIRTTALAALPWWCIERELDLAHAAAPARPASPNDRPGIALVGCGGMGRADAREALRFGDLLAVCDVDQTRAQAAAQQFAKNGNTPAIYSDFRKLLERNDIHVIIQAAPDHWHTLINMAAAHAGKDIYAEKPLTLTIDEGRRLVSSIRKHQVILQTGSQQRSSQLFRTACELVRNGRLGKLKKVISYLPAGPAEGPFSAAPAPVGLNWDFWLGQAPKVDYVPQRCHSNFRYWLDYSGGTLTDWGAHHNDIARWAIDEPGPVSVEGRVLATMIPGGYDAFADYEVQLAYASGILHHIRSTRADDQYGSRVLPEGQRHGVRFEGADGWIWVTRGDLDASDEDLLYTPLPDSAVRLEISGDHMRNFFDSVRSRRDPICPVEAGHRSAALCHLAVICLRLGKPLQWNPKLERFLGQSASEANLLLERPQREPYTYAMAG